jgi:GTP-binding protein
MFVDRAKIFVKGGDGGNGVVAFRREKYVPEGGPAGGDGGRGGSVLFVTDPGLTTLMDFKYRSHYKGQRGEHGQGKNMHGANSPDLVIKVPVGTVVKDVESDEVLADLVTREQTFVAAKGGRGGRGNARFATSVNRAPALAEKGAPGEERWLLLELKLLADVGLVGLPNAGKSTLISRISAARPKIADYPFTTLIPNLGVVQIAPGESFVVADIPGLIAGAHQGTGLGFEFLRHIERTRLLLFVLDCSGNTGGDPIEDYKVLRQELELYRADLATRPCLVAANKIDSPLSEAVLERLRTAITDVDIFPISALTGEGVERLVHKMYEMISQFEDSPSVIQEEVTTRLKEEPPFVIEVVGPVFEVSGKRIEKLVAMTDLDNEEALQRFQRIIERMGLNSALRKLGAQSGDLVRINDLEFEFLD